MNKRSRFKSRIALVAVFCGAGLLGSADHGSSLAQTVAAARTQDIHPQKEAPTWMDWARVKNGLAFFAAHQKGFIDVLSTTSLVETYAGIDIAPVTVHTGRLVKGYTQRIMETGFAIEAMLQPATGKATFIKSAYAKAYDLGTLHAQIGKSIKPEDLGWKASDRHVMNQQAFALVLYAFAWQPIESLEATKEIDPVKDAAGIDDWMYLWRVFGTALGVEQPLLPGNADASGKIVAALRNAQYPAPGQPKAEGADLLVKGEIKFVMLLAGLTGPAGTRTAAKGLAADLERSPGLVEALRLGPDPAKTLVNIASN